MKLHDIKILTDENISPKVVAFLRQYGIDTLDTKEQNWHGQNDEDLMSTAYQDKRFVLTHDSDFGTLAINERKPCYGILYLRVNNLNPGNVIRVCENVFRKDIDVFPGTILVIEDTRIRIRHLSKEL
mgnify:CR=1 FL=1